MVNVYYGRENLDKEAFIFDSIRDGEQTLLLVPEQFTLQSERNALDYLHVEGFIDFEVLSLTRLRTRIFSETGGAKMVPVDKYGRHMLLSKILTDASDDLEAYKGYESRTSFIEIINNFISEMKQFNVEPSDLQAVLSDLKPEDEVLRRKIHDISLVFEQYEATLEGKYIDTEDFLSLFIAKIPKSDLVKNSVVWISGFDTFTPKNLDILTEIMRTAKETNFVLTHDPNDRMFNINGDLIGLLKVKANEAGVGVSVVPVAESYAYGRPECIQFIEEQLFTYPYREFGSECKELQLVGAANLYAEAETAAARIVELVRDEGLRYKDMLVICNDMEVRAPLIRRVFESYGLPVFIDKRRAITHNPILEYITALMDIAAGGYRYEDVFRLIKTNLLDIDRETAENLENYAIKYKVRGSSWKRPFKYGVTEYDDEVFASLEVTRKYIYELVSLFESAFKEGRTVREKTQALYDFISEKAELPEQVNSYIESLESEGRLEYAEEMAQVWNIVIDLFDQIVTVMGDVAISANDYSDTLRSGFEAIDIGILPPSIDQIIVGTMQRTRSSNVQVLLVLGANDGLLPKGDSGDELLADDEMARIFNRSNETQRRAEEQIAIYRNFSKPQKYLYVSYAGSDIDGNEIRPSTIFDKLSGMFPDNEILKDIQNRGNPSLLVETQTSALNYLTRELREKNELAPLWNSVYTWFKENRDEALEKIIEGLSFANKREKIDEKYVDQLYRKSNRGDGSLLVSPSALETYSRCPFAYFMNYAMRLQGRRSFEVDRRDMGDIYHDVLMRYGKELLRPVTREESEQKVDDIFDEVLDQYKEGLLVTREFEKYQTARLKKVAKEIIWVLTEQAQIGKIDDMYVETKFAPIEINVGDKKVLIEGKVDRLDVIGENRAKIIDYKSGLVDKFNVEDVRSGWSLQLMLYLQGVRTYEPAGVFYFQLKEPDFEVNSSSLSDVSDEVESEQKKAYKLNGIVVDEPEVLDAINTELIEYKKDSIVDRETFDELRSDVEALVNELCRDLVEGTIDAEPKNKRKKNACEYCKYRGICRFSDDD